MFDIDPTSFNQWQYRRNNNARRQFYDSMAAMLDNGVPVTEAIEELKRVRVRISGNKHIEVAAYDYWTKRMQRGQKLSSAVDGWVPDDENILLSAGEQSGTLPETFRELIKIIDTKVKIKKTIMGALLVPVIQLLIVLGFILAFAFWAVPFYRSIAPDVQFTGLAGILVAASTLIREYFFVGLVALVALMALYLYSLKNWAKSSTRSYLDRKFLPYRIYRVVNGSAWLTSLSALLNAGVPIMEALDHTSKTNSKWLKTRIQAISSKLRDSTLGEAMDESGYDFPDIEIIGQTIVFSRYAAFDKALKNISKKWVENSLEGIGIQMKVVNSVLFITVIAIVLTLALGLTDIAYQLQSNLKNSMS
ncbi:MAG: type II secretion system F family protein [Hydrogenovibrio sp.]